MVEWLEDRGRRIDNKQRVFLTRRSLDFLIVMLINTRMTDAEKATENPEIDHRRIFSAVQAVCGELKSSRHNHGILTKEHLKILGLAEEVAANTSHTGGVTWSIDPSSAECF